MWPFKKKKKYIAPWWMGYIDFPPTTDVVLSNGKIIVIDNEHSKALIYENKGAYLNTKIAEFDI